MRPGISTVVTLKGRVRKKARGGSHSPKDGRVLVRPCPGIWTPKWGLGSLEHLSVSKTPGPMRHAEEGSGTVMGGGKKATARRSLTWFWHKLFISFALYHARMMFPYPMPLGAMLNNHPLASGLSEGISSGASISQFVLCNLRITISIKSERRRGKNGGKDDAEKMAATAVFRLSGGQ